MARIASPYINSTGKCIELFYWFYAGDQPTSSEQMTLSVIALDKERQETRLKELKKGPQGWSRMFLDLPDGINQVVVEGRRGMNGKSGMSIDDITIQECNKFGELFL